MNQMGQAFHHALTHTTAASSVGSSHSHAHPADCLPQPLSLLYLQVRRVKALRTVGKGAKEEQGGGAEDGGGGGDPMDGITTSGTGSTAAEGMGDGEGGATAAARAKRGTRRKNKERKVL